MTNTNDFRRYSYATDPAYLINQFDFQRSSRNSQTAPKIKPEVQRDFKVRENVRVKSREQLKKEQRSAAIKVAVVSLVALMFLAMVGMVVNSFVVKNEITKQITATQTQIANAQSENISLQSKLDALVSISMIDEYAVDKLGMVKVKSNQIQYMDVNEYKAQRQLEIQNSTPADSAKQLEKTVGNK